MSTPLDHPMPAGKSCLGVLEHEGELYPLDETQVRSLMTDVVSNTPKMVFVQTRRVNRHVQFDEWFAVKQRYRLFVMRCMVSNDEYRQCVIEQADVQTLAGLI